MKLVRVLLLGLAATVAAACNSDGTESAGPTVPLASIRFINAVPDTGAVDFRFVDKIENLPTFLGVAPRGGSGFYQGVEAGARVVTVFVNDSTIAGASVRLVNQQTITLDANQRYTLLLAGSARAAAGSANALRLLVLPEPRPAAPPAGQIAVRVINTIPGTGTVDVTARNVGPDSLTVPATPTVATGAAFLAPTAYANLTARPANQTPNALYRFFVNTAGTATSIGNSTPNLPGVAASGTSTAQPGVQLAGSRLTAVVFAPVPANARGAGSGVATAGVGLFVDEVLP